MNHLPKIKPILKSKKDKYGRCPIYISISKHRRQRLIRVGYMVPPNAWNKREGKVYEVKPRLTPALSAKLTQGEIAMLKEEFATAEVLHNAKTINSEIQNKVSALVQLQTKIRSNDESLDLKNIKKQFDIDPDSDRAKNFLIYAEDARDNLLKSGNIGTHTRYKTVLKRLSDHMNGKILTFQDITHQFLNDYKADLQKAELKTNSIHNHFKTIRAIFNKAIREEVVPQDKNPFTIFQLNEDKNTKKEKLNEEEINKIEELIFPEYSLLWNCKNTFIFSFNVAGIRIGDLLQLKWSNITTEGRIEYRMAKTGTLKSIKLNTKANKILSYYSKNKKMPSDYIFPFLSCEENYSDKTFLFRQVSAKTSLINKYLKKIGEHAKIEKKITTHIARHSFSDIARAKGKSVYDISRVLGHSSINITETYLAKMDLNSQDEMMEGVLGV